MYSIFYLGMDGFCLLFEMNSLFVDCLSIYRLCIDARSICAGLDADANACVYRCMIEIIVLEWGLESSIGDEPYESRISRSM